MTLTLDVLREKKKDEERNPKCKIKQIRNLHFAGECVSCHALPFKFYFQVFKDS